MEETIKKGIEEFGDKIRNARIRYSSQGIHDTQIYFTKSFIKTYTINILKAQNKELRKEKRTMRAAEETGSDVGAGYTIGFNRALKDQIERNNKIINNLSK